jgi:hypothetical protein
MQFALERQQVKLANFNARSELHGEDREPAADLKIEMTAPNDILSEFDPDLKSSLYRKANGTDAQAELLSDGPGYLPKLRFPKMGAFDWGEQLAGAVLTIHWGPSGRSDLVLQECIVDKFSFAASDGGQVFITFRVRCKPDEKQAGKLFTMTQTTIEISLAPPTIEARPESDA